MPEIETMHATFYTFWGWQEDAVTLSFGEMLDGPRDGDVGFLINGHWMALPVDEVVHLATKLLKVTDSLRRRQSDDMLPIGWREQLSQPDS